MAFVFFTPLLLLLVSISQSQIAPTWITSNYLQAAARKVIDGDLCSCKTGNTSTPTATLNFNFAFPTAPNLGYGCSGYEGNDYLGFEMFEINRTGLTTTSFSVKVQISGYTNLWILQVRYIAISKSFPHHLNSFDNVPVNYANGALVNISTNSSQSRTYQNIINYTAQANSEGYTFNQFSLPLTNNKVLLFLTSMFLTGTLDTSTPLINNSVSFSIGATVQSFETYSLIVTIAPKCYLTRLHFSMIIFDIMDVQASGQYILIYDRIQFTNTGGQYSFPAQFLSNFMIGFTQFSSFRTATVIQFAINYVVISGIHKLKMPQSGNRQRDPTISRFNFTLFYLKSWICPTNTVFDPSIDLCITCPISNCLTCFNLTTCSICVGGYFLNPVNRLCDPCAISGCINCSSLTICLDCNSTANYVLSANQSCVLCSPNYFANSTSQNCEPCTLSFCLACSSLTQCSSCDNSFYLNPNGTCVVCDPLQNLFMNSNSSCELCALQNCLSCSSLTTCQACTTGYVLNSNDSLCYFCSLSNCVTCSTLNSCSACSSGFVLNSTTYLCQQSPCSVANCQNCPQSPTVCSICNLGYELSNGICQQKCGDFIKTGLQQCDDGNTQSADGCSSSCTIEPDFVCQSVNNSLGSSCYFVGEIRIEVVYIEKINYLNKIQILLEYFPKGLSFWDSFDFVNIVEIQSIIPISGVQISRNANGTVLLSFEYGSDIHEQTINLQINPSNSGIDALSRAPSTSYSLLIKPDDNESAYFYDSSVYGRANVISLICTIVSIISLVFFILGLISGKMIGVDMMAVMQISFLSLMTLPELNPCFAALSSLKLVNGYNYLNKNHLEDQLTTDQIKGVYLFSRFASNFNFTIAIILIPLIVSLISFILSKTLFRNSLKVEKIFKRSLGEYTLNGLLFSGYIIAVSFVLQIKYGIQNSEGLIGKLSLPLSIACLILIFFYIFFLAFKQQYFGQFTNSFLPNKFYPKYYCFMLIERLIVGCSLVLMLTVDVQLVVPIIIFVFVGIFVLVKKPYHERYHSWRVLANMFIASVIMAIYLSYKLTTASNRKGEVFLYLPMLVVILLIICLLYNVVAMIYNFYLWVKNRNSKYSQDQFNIEKLQEDSKTNENLPMKLTEGRQQFEMKPPEIEINIEKLKNQIQKDMFYKKEKDPTQVQFNENILALQAKQYEEI